MGVKGQKISQNGKEQLHLSRAISQEQYSLWSWFLVQLCKMMISPVFFFKFSYFHFSGSDGGKRAIKSPKWEVTILLHAISQEQYSLWSWVLVHLCKMMISPGVFFIFCYFHFLGSQRGKRGPKKWPKMTKKHLSVAVDISGTIYHIIVICGALV